MEEIREVSINTGYGSEVLELCASCTATLTSDLGKKLVKSKPISQGKCEWCGASTLDVTGTKG